MTRDRKLRRARRYLKSLQIIAGNESCSWVTCKECFFNARGLNVCKRSGTIVYMPERAEAILKELLDWEMENAISSDERPQ